jgi:hypothetical protein
MSDPRAVWIKAVRYHAALEEVVRAAGSLSREMSDPLAADALQRVASVAAEALREPEAALRGPRAPTGAVAFEVVKDAPAGTPIEAGEHFRALRGPREPAATCQWERPNGEPCDPSHDAACDTCRGGPREPGAVDWTCRTCGREGDEHRAGGLSEECVFAPTMGPREP